MEEKRKEQEARASNGTAERMLALYVNDLGLIPGILTVPQAPPEQSRYPTGFLVTSDQHYPGNRNTEELEADLTHAHQPLISASTVWRPVGCLSRPGLWRGVRETMKDTKERNKILKQKGAGMQSPD